MGTGVDADLGKGTGSAARARELYAATLFRRASALALIGMAAFTDIGMITRRRAGWPVRRVSMRSRITRQSPAYAPCDAFADVSATAPAIASADTARRIRFITASFFSRKECQRPSARSSSGYYRNFKVPGTLRNRAPHRDVHPVYSAGLPRGRGRPLTKLRAFICALYGACH
jgi:hypothetical protein